MKHISNKAILVFVFVLLLVPLQSCKNVVKKVVKESADKSVKLGVEKVAEEAGERTLRELGEKSVREVPWDDVLKALERENPLLGKRMKLLRNILATQEKSKLNLCKIPILQTITFCDFY